MLTFVLRVTVNAMGQNSIAMVDIDIFIDELYSNTVVNGSNTTIPGFSSRAEQVSYELSLASQDTELDITLLL